MSTLRAEVAAFIDLEADMLDFNQYREWLDLWEPDGVYVVPIDRETEDFANTLNFAYDKAEMRSLRVARLLSGDAISTQTTYKTVRSVSRLRILAEDGDTVKARCSQFIAENRHGNLKTYPADVTFTLRRSGDGFRMVEKVVRLLNADHHLSSIGYIL
ncbi:aromatic-ring-hydroxylating dioxygenase subunit beta [Azospirillum rugosum]|uniref:3-phenylpropionate/cinnamic acid dioxygenase small subunit n=1 Tax=Azospirillum rugosum TaxID=416170 RepID=A0ABS4SJL0_9PROT|nr:aromatic-ring-hydroxylating dioxygenase subunit beta [Azospirillum rugosum]MBP2292749.1 3-phenylpropionate/cinnamic acid dioxygenase small subunit [Azospirillum rugosum]MDQ0527008.1 3-phenylpropionate/cinnamic acid dioxygenase small subunit [Azospirillum rugosum]